METEIWSLSWSDDLSVGIPEIDHEHQRFISLVNDLNRSIVDRMELTEIRKRLQSILDHAQVDAAIEDHILSQKGLPDATDHAQSHQIMEFRMHEILDGLHDHSTLYEWIDASLKVKKMLIGHFLNEDMKLRELCRP